MPVFGRVVEFGIGQAGQTAHAVPDLRVAFQVRMDRGKNPNTASIRVWNVNPLILSVLNAGPAPTVSLKVGYGDPLVPPGAGITIPRSIFLGEVVRDGLRDEKQGPDRIVEIEAKDALSKYQLGRVALTFATSVPMSAVVAAVAGQLALPVGSIVVAPDVVRVWGGTFSGPARDVLDDIAASTNSDWWITDGVFFFAPKGAPTPGLVPVFSSLTGNLIGSPVKKDRGKVEIRGLLDASVRPGSSFVVDSVGLKGTFVADSVEFQGDSGYDVPFYVRIVGRPPGT